MAITFVGSSGVSNGLAQGTSAVLSRPAGVADGDFLLAFISLGNTAAVTPPAGWTSIALGVTTAPNLQCVAWWKVAASEPVSWTWTFSAAAYVAIAHATRGVSHLVNAQQSDDGLNLLIHSTPTLAAPDGAWLVSSWTGRNLLALGWAPPLGDTERQDLLGGLLVLLNVNHAVDDSNGAVVAGNYSRSAASLISVRSLNALAVLAPLLPPLVHDPPSWFARFGAATLTVGLVSPTIGGSAVIPAPTLGPPGITSPIVIHTGSVPGGTLIAGEVVIGLPVPIGGSTTMPPGTLAPGEAVLVGMPWVTPEEHGMGSLVPGDLEVSAPPVYSHDAVTSSAAIVLGLLLSDAAPLDLALAVPDAALGLSIGSHAGPFDLMADDSALFGGGMIFKAGAAPNCCASA